VVKPGEASRRRCPNGEDDPRPDERQLKVEVRRAGGHLGLFEGTVPGRSALDDVRDVRVVAAETGVAEQRVESLAGIADEREAVGIRNPNSITPRRRHTRG
jgi:hypothetical protein